MIAAVHVDSSEQIADALRQVAGKGVIVQPWGSGSWETTVVGADLQVLRLGQMRLNRILRIEPADFFAQCEPGVLLADLATELAEQNLSFPFLTRESAGTVGGLVASGQVRNGKDFYRISRWVIALKVVLADARETATGALTFKSVAGYDLARLFCGSFGTLGVISEVSLRLYPAGKPPFGKDLQPQPRRLPKLCAPGEQNAPASANERLAQQIKNSFDPQGVFPRISGWNPI
ncbi:MAG: FAD-binding oxidoreductase [bacterium]